MGELEFREATLDDASFSADVHTEVLPERPTDPVVERYWWAQPDDTFVIRRWVVRRDGADIGVAYFEHPAWERLEVPHGDIGGEILPAHRERATLDAMLAEMERRARRRWREARRGPRERGRRGAPRGDRSIADSARIAADGAGCWTSPRTASASRRWPPSAASACARRASALLTLDRRRRTRRSIGSSGA